MPAPRTGTRASEGPTSSDPERVMLESCAARIMASFQADRSVTLFTRSPILSGSIARRLQKVGPPPWLLVLSTICSANAIAAILLGKEMNWDLLNYHFYNGYALLHGRFALDLAPAQAQTLDRKSVV